MALGTTLPFWPALLFTYIEPITILLGSYAATFDPTFLPSQTPTPPLTPPSDASLLITYSLGNAFFVLALLGILCTAITREARVTKFWLVIAGMGDLGHIYANYTVLGKDVFWDFGGWNEMMWGNIALGVFLWVNRVATLAGAFGRVKNRR